MRNAESIEAHAERLKISDMPPEKTEKRGRHPNSRANLCAPWEPGQSGNPGGRVKNDMAAEISRAIFENNPKLVYKAYVKALSKGSGFTFQVLSDRAYGKLKEQVDVNVTGTLAQRLEKARKRKAVK
jgi:hypothetical protein